MMRTIFFDFDGVLTTDGNGSGTVCRNLQKAVPDVSFDDLYRCYRAHHGQLMVGKASHADIWPDVCRCVGKEIDVGLLHDAFVNAPKNEEMFQLSQALKPSYKIGIITDNPKERFEALVTEMQLDTLFDYLILSADVGAKKNEPKIFEEALRMAGCQASECVFIDNQERNLVVPSAMGFHTIWHDDAKNDIGFLRGQLSQYGVAIG